MNLTVESRTKIDDSIKKVLKKKFGDNVKIVERVNKDMKGGIKIRKGNDLFDGSIKNLLEQLRKKLYSYSN